MGQTRSNIRSVAECTGVLNAEDADTNDDSLNNNVVEPKYATDRTYKHKIIWHLVVAMVSLYLGAIYGVYLMFTSAKFATLIYGKY